MEIAGAYAFAAPPERVWNLLLDPAVIASCLPGCDTFEPDGEDRYRVRLTVALTAITGTYEGNISISEKVSPTSYRLVAEGQGRPGSVSGNAAIALREDAEGTIVDVSATVETRGTIARMGQRLIGGVSQMMMDRFFACLKSKL
jgi:carbon monoxide dehydrogenase subunit G